MALAAAVLIVLVGVMHSAVGGRRLVGPIARRDDLPVILGDMRLSRLTLRAGWHALTLAYWGFAALLAWPTIDPAARSAPVLVVAAILFGATGAAAFALSRGRHLSWLLFLPAAALCAADALSR